MIVPVGFVNIAQVRKTERSPLVHRTTLKFTQNVYEKENIYQSLYSPLNSLEHRFRFRFLIFHIFLRVIQKTIPSCMYRLQRKFMYLYMYIKKRAHNGHIYIHKHPSIRLCLGHSSLYGNKKLYQIKCWVLFHLQSHFI